MIYDVGSITDGENASNILGQTVYTSTTNFTTQAGLNVPTDVVYDSATKKLFVAQQSANRVTVYNLADGIQNGENAVNVLGQANFTASTAATTQAGMNVPYGIALSGSTALFVANSSGHRATVYDVTTITDGENAVSVLGQANFTATTAATTQVGMNTPSGIAYDAATKKLYVTQTTGNRVTVYDVASITNGENAVSVLGQANFTTTTAASTQAGMNSPTGVYIDSAHSKLYVPQSGSNRVSIFDVASITDGENAVDLLGQYDDDVVTPGPIYTKSATHNGTSKFGLNGTGPLSNAISVALDPTDHRLFVSDAGNNRVLEYNLDSNNVLLDLLPDHILGQTNYYTATAATTQAGMNLPVGITYDDTNNRLFVTQQSGNRVTVYDVASITDGENATGVLGQANFTDTAAASTQTGMNNPAGIAYDSANQRLFVSQFNGHRVTSYDVATVTNGENATGVLGQISFGAADGGTTQSNLFGPAGMALSGSTTLFISTRQSHRVVVFDVVTVTAGENAISVLGQTNFTNATSGGATQAGMSFPVDAAYDATNKKLYVGMSGRVTIYNTGDGITNGENAINVLGAPNFGAAPGTADSAGISTPGGMALDPPRNRLYLGDQGFHRVTVYNLLSGLGSGEPAINVLGQANFTATTAATTQAGMNIPYDVTLSGSTTLFVSQGTGNRVTTYDVATITDGENAVNVLGQTTFTATTAATTQAGMNAPRGIAYDAANKTLYVSQTTGNRVTTYSLGDGITDGENATKVLGQSSFTTTAAATTQVGLNAPTGVYIDTANGKLYVPQTTGNRVSVFSVSTIENGEAATDVLGQTDNDLNPPGPIYTKTTVQNAPYKLGLSTPQGVAVDGTNHRLFVADSSNNRVLVYNLSAGNVLIDTIPDNVLGQPTFWQGAVATTQAGLSSPTGLTFDASNNMLYAADLTNNRIMVYDTASITDGENAAYVLGQPNFTTATATTTQYGLSGPRQIAYDSTSGQLFVADATNNRITAYTVDPPVAATATGTTLHDIFHFFGW